MLSAIVSGFKPIQPVFDMNIRPIDPTDDHTEETGESEKPENVFLHVDLMSSFSSVGTVTPSKLLKTAEGAASSQLPCTIGR